MALLPASPAQAATIRQPFREGKHRMDTPNVIRFEGEGLLGFRNPIG
ncbi:MAG: hypothetical protein O7A09_03245 [Proteobacteria bacterium]|nr:hypothetical protein [Pseudomonadota bacterium]MCZ6785242.1 hypothetical protein [Pseudomonadota bacterium]